MSISLTIVEDDLTGDAIAALLRFHLDETQQWSPHAMQIERLRVADVAFYSAWDGEQLAGCGALRRLDAGHGEIKSMRAAPNYRSRGVGRAILFHLLTAARGAGYGRVSLETRTADAYLPARRLYESAGFACCEPFADYRPDPNSVFMTMAL